MEELVDAATNAAEAAFSEDHAAYFKDFDLSYASRSGEKLDELHKQELPPEREKGTRQPLQQPPVQHQMVSQEDKGQQAWSQAPLQRGYLQGAEQQHEPWDELTQPEVVSHDRDSFAERCERLLAFPPLPANFGNYSPRAQNAAHAEERDLEAAVPPLSEGQTEESDSQGKLPESEMICDAVLEAVQKQGKTPSEELEAASQQAEANRGQHLQQEVQCHCWSPGSSTSAPLTVSNA